MALNLIKQIAVLGQRSLTTKTLSTGKSKFPLLPVINVQIRGYDYPVLECYQSYIHKLADVIQIDIDNGWPLPPQEFKIQKYKTGTTKIKSEFNLKIYERNIQMSEVSSVKCSILIRALEAALPQGVVLNVNVYDLALEQKRYIPDKELIDLKSALDTLKTKT